MSSRLPSPFSLTRMPPPPSLCSIQCLGLSPHLILPSRPRLQAGREPSHYLPRGLSCAEWWVKGLHPQKELPPGFCQCCPCIAHILGPYFGAHQQLLALSWRPAAGSCPRIAGLACAHLTHAASPLSFESCFLHWKMRAGARGSSPFRGCSFCFGHHDEGSVYMTC